MKKASRKHGKKILIVLAAIPLLLWVIWLVFPETAIQSIIEDSIPDKKLGLEVNGIQKGLFYDFKIEHLILKNQSGELVSLRNIHGRIDPLSLAGRRLNLSFDGGIGAGDMSGHVNFKKNMLNAGFDFNSTSINDIPLFKRAGIKGRGIISGRFFMTGDKGHFEFAAKDASFEPVDFSGTKVPLNFFQSITGAMNLQGNTINIASVSLEGKDIYARLKGTVKDSDYELNMELMPGKSFIENPLFVMEFEKYKVSPGYYFIPVKGSLSF